MWLSSRSGLLALLLGSAVGGCAQVDSTGLTNPVGEDGATGLPDFASTDEAQSGGPDFAVPSAYDLASGDLASGIQVCNVAKIRVNEVSTQGSAGATDEYIELYNPCMADITMTGAQIVYRSATGTSDSPALWVFTNEIIASHGFFVLANTAFTGTSNAKPFQNSGGLYQGGGSVGLRDSQEVLIDSVGWGTANNALVEGTPVGAPSASQSAARTVDGVDTNNNLADFSLGARTPGATN